ncbi:hypothetical protein [Methylococcus sp. EFPC2]|nr:hypothetical protein [Methylococcus sp. EFPC2]QSA98030.1 hypothetical protein JWZ97_04195 [Methylococcus sp. EFPC2]
MDIFWLILALIVLVLVGNAMLLLRSAKSSKPPDTVKPQPYDDEDSNW